MRERPGSGFLLRVLAAQADPTVAVQSSRAGDKSRSEGAMNSRSSDFIHVEGQEETWSGDWEWNITLKEHH